MRRKPGQCQFVVWRNERRLTSASPQRSRQNPKDNAGKQPTASIPVALRGVTAAITNQLIQVRAKASTIPARRRGQPLPAFD